MSYFRLVLFILLATAISGCGQNADNQSTPEKVNSPTVAPLKPAQEPSQDLVWYPGWQLASPMSTPRSGAAAIEIDGVIHVIGGALSDKFLDSSEYSRIQPDGSLGPWQPGPSLNGKRGFSSAVRFNNHVYVVAGARGPNGQILLDSVERSEIMPDGTLGKWSTEKQILNNTRRCIKLALLGNQIYAFGGFAGVLLDSVERTTIQPDGSLGEWEVLIDAMNLPRYIHGVERVRDRVYVVGGHDKEKGLGINDVEWSQEDDEGWLAPWKMTEPLQTGRYGLAAVQRGDYLYALGGLNGAAYLESIEKSAIAADGSLSAWQFTTPLPFPLEGMNVIQARDRLYVIGGSNLNGYSPEVMYATFNQQGDLGSWVTPAEARSARAKDAEAQAKQSTLPNEGVITKHIKAEHYSFVIVTKDDGMWAWLAGPVGDISVGTRVQFPDGVVMNNFWSKELKKNFPAIMFVGELRQVNEGPKKSK